MLNVGTDYADFKIISMQASVQFNGDEYLDIEILSTKWTHIAFVVDMLSLEIHVNGEVRDFVSSEISEYFIDLAEYEHVFGKNYEGFIYSIVINQKSTSGNDIDVAPICTEFDCETCPESTCLSHCTHLEYVDPDTRACESCEENCVTGCIRGTDCRNCDNELCQSCIEYENCETCLPSSIEVDDVCVCPENEIFSHDEDTCRECKEN